MDEIRQVFEGSCALIPIKPVANECKKLADDFIPEMVEALASQMNPQVIYFSEKFENQLKFVIFIRSFAPRLDFATTPQLISFWRSTRTKNHRHFSAAVSATTLEM